MAAAGSSPTPQWDSRNRGFIPPSQLQRLRQSSPLAREFSSERPRSMAATSSQSLRPSPTTASTHTRSSSFFAFLKSNDNTPSTMPSRSTEPGPRLPANSDEIGRLSFETRQPSLPSASVLDRSPSLPMQQPMQLHPEIRSVVTLTHAHAHKVYMSGPLIRRVERLPDGHHPIKDEGWREVWAQLGGTTLSIWDMKEIDEASKEGREVPPTYINVTDAFVQVLGAVTIPASGGAPAQKFSNVVTVNTAGSNLLLFSCPSSASLISWATALRLASWEKARLEEIYTAHLVRITLNDGRTAPSTLVRGRREGWVRIRVAGQTDWKHLWMAVTSGPTREASGGTPQPGTPPDPPQHKRRISFFGRDHNQTQPPSAEPLIAFYLSPKPKDRKRPFLTLRDITQAFAVYPERPELINKSTLMKIEGTIGDEEVAMAMRKREGWILIMPELETGVPQANETIRWLIAIHDVFSLYGRPRAYSWDPRDEASMMYAYPVGPARDSLFLEREMAENMDPRTDHTSAVRARLLNILSLRIQALSSQNVPPKLSNPDASSTLPPHPSTEEPASGTPQNGFTSLSRLPSLAFASSGPEATHRALTPIVESSSSERDPGRLLVNGAIGASSDNNASSQPSQEARNDVTNASTPTQLSAPSVYSPTTEATSVPITPPLEPVSEKASIIPNMSPVLEVALANGGSSERPHVSDGNQAKDVGPSSPTVHSFNGSATSRPSRSSVDSSNPTAPISPAQAVPRTPSPGLSILTSPHSMTESPARPNQSFAEIGATGLSVQSPTSPTVLQAIPLQPSKLSQDSVQASTDSSQDEATGIYDEAGVLYFIHQMDQGSLDVKPQPPPEMNGQDVSSGSKKNPLSPIVQPSTAPLRPKSASPPPTASSGRSLPPIDVVSHRKPPSQQLPRTPTLDYGPERRPAGARAAPVSNRQDTASLVQPRNGDTRQGRMSHLEDPDADALAALTFLERHDDNVPNAPLPASVSSTSSADFSPPSPPSGPREEPPSIVEPDIRPPSPESENASVYKSSFAPSKNAMQRKARTEAQQAAHEAATHRPGRGTAKAKNKPKRGGAWGDSSEEDEDDEEEEEEDEDVDSDGQPANGRDDRSVSNYAASLNQRSRLSTPRGPSPLPSGDLPSQQPQPRPPRNLPPVPVLRGQVHDGDSFGPRHIDQFEGGRKSYYEDGVSHGGAAPQGPIPTHAPAPVAPRHMWSQVLDPGHNAGAVPETNNPRGTFIQLDPPEQSMTKAFTPHGLLSAGLQDKEDRSAKKQEELARETGASLINVPNKPPPPQTGLLGAITAHERDRKREGGVGAALTEREREKRLAEDRQRKLDELQRQQLEQMQQGGSLYGQQLAGFNPMMNPMNPMMMGMNPMAPSFMGYPGMMPNFGNPQHMFAAQQAAQAYQQAMFSLSQAGSQIGGEGGTPAPMSLMLNGAGMGPSPGPINPMMAGGMSGASPAPLNPMMTGGGMGGASPAPLNPMMTGGGMGAYDPRFSMMSMSMMNPMAMGMGMGNPGMVGAPMGMGVPMNNGAGFDPRMSQFDAGLQVSNSPFIQPGRAASITGLDPSPGAGDGARRSANASPRPPQ